MEYQDNAQMSKCFSHFFTFYQRIRTLPESDFQQFRQCLERVIAKRQLSISYQPYQRIDRIPGKSLSSLNLETILRIKLLKKHFYDDSKSHSLDLLQRLQLEVLVDSSGLIQVQSEGSRNYIKFAIGMNQLQGKTIKCPFDPSHVMPYDRFLNHLEKCKFQDKKSYAKCKYNPYHVIHKDQIASHQQRCQDKAKFQEDSDGDWGVEDDWVEEAAKPEKSTVSTSVSTKLTSKPNKKHEEEYYKLHNNSRFMAESFDDYDFNNCSRKR